MDALLGKQLTEMKASYPHFNPYYRGDLPHKKSIPVIRKHKIEDGVISANFKEQGAKVVAADLVYTKFPKESGYQEWFKTPMKIKDSTVKTKLPEGTLYAFINLIDENGFLVSYPKLKPVKKGKVDFSGISINIANP